MKRPSFQFYPGDWLHDTALRACSLAARGLWIDMLSFMHQGSPYGHLTLPAPKNISKDTLRPILPPVLARMVGCGAQEVEALLIELEAAGVFSRTDDGVIFSRRMVKDEELRQIRAAGGLQSLDNPNVPRRKQGGKDGYKDGCKVSFGPSPSSSSSSSVLERESTFANEVLPDAETKLLRLAKSHPQGNRVLGSQLPNDLVAAMIDAVTLEANEQGISHQQAYEYLMQRNESYARAVANWPPTEKRFIANHVRWYRNHEYRDDQGTWRRETGGNTRSKSAVPIPQRSAAAERQRQLMES
jgi:hypothetical protein